jgi:hypothetical protein
MPAAIARVTGRHLRGELPSVWFSFSSPKQALAKLESEDAGFVQRFRHIIRLLVTIFDHTHGRAVV